MQGTEQEEEDIISSINVTPLVDITLVLLIIFMVTATFILAPSIKVSLPKAYTGESTPVSSIAIILGKEGKLFLNGKPTTEQALMAVIPSALRKDPSLQAIIGADKDVRHGEVIHIIDLVRRLGVTRFAINVEKAPDEGSPIK